MARIPYTGIAEVAPTPTPPGDYQNIATNPRQFGAQVGEAMQQAGADANKLGEYFGDVAAQQALNNWQQEADNVLFGDPGKPGDVGYYGLHGQAAMDQRQATLRRLQDAYKRNLSGLSGPAQLTYDRQARYLMSRLQAEMGRHYDQESRAWASETNNAQYQNAIAGSARRPEDESYATDMLGQATAARLRKLQVDGALPLDPSQATPEQHAIIDRESRQAQVDLATARIRSLMVTNPAAAQRIFTQNQDVLSSSPHYDALAHQLRAGADTDAAMAAVNAALGRPAAAPSGDLADRIIGAESGGNPNAKNPLSSASGPGQFIDSTWLSLIKGAAPDIAAGKSDAQILALRNDPALAKQMVAAYAQQNAAELQSKGLPTDDGALYLAHFLGAGGAETVLAADPATPMRNLVSAEVLRANPNIANKTAGDVRALTANLVRSPLPTQIEGPLSRGQQALAATPDYLSARAAIINNGALNDRQRKLALEYLNGQFHQEVGLYNEMDAAAKRQLADHQSANGADLMARAIAGEVVPDSQLSDWVRTQQITPEAYRAYKAEIVRQGKGQDDLSVFNDLDRRARAGEDVSQDIQKAVETGQLKGATALQLQRAADARKQREGDQIERASFATLRTIAGMDAQEHPMVDLGRPAQQAQIALWGQAQQEWNRRVLIGHEDPSAVLADMAPRYSHPVQDITALPRPRMGTISAPTDIADIAQKTQAARDAGQLSDQQFRDEQDLILRYKAIFDAQQQRKDAAAAARGAAPSSAARGRVEMR